MDTHNAKVSRLRLADIMVRVITERITGGHVQPGDRIGSEPDVMLEFGLSRSIVREALRMLERDGLISVRTGPNGGVFAAEPGVQTLSRSIDLVRAFHDVGPEKLIEARSELEVDVARLAARRWEQSDLEELERLNREWIRLVDAEDLEAAARVNVAFHLALAEAAKNPFLQAFLRAMEQLIYESALEPQYPARHLPYVRDSHESILEPLRRRDYRQTGTRMRTHLRTFRPGWSAQQLDESLQPAPKERLLPPSSQARHDVSPQGEGSRDHGEEQQAVIKEEMLSRIRSAIVNLDRDALSALTDMLDTAGIDLMVAIEEGYTAGVRRVGEMFGKDEVFLPELVRAGKLVKEELSRLERRIPASEKEHKGTVLIGTVEGDIHDIGKDLVCAMLVSRGIQVIDIGVDCPAARFVDEAVAGKADIIAASCLLTLTLPKLNSLMTELHRRRLRSDFKVVMGGAAVSRAYAAQLGADGYGQDMIEAIEVIAGLLEATRAGI